MRLHVLRVARAMTKGVECRLSRLHSLGPRATCDSNVVRGRWLQRTRERQQRAGTAGDGESESSLETARKSRLRVGPPTRGQEYVLRRLCQGAPWVGEEREHRLRHHIAVPMTEATRPTSRDSACGAREPKRCCWRPLGPMRQGNPTASQRPHAADLARER
jgi:hypothetical protein